MVYRRIAVSWMLMAIGVLPACAQTISNLQDTRRRVGAPPVEFPTTAPATLESQLMPMDRIDKPTSLDDQLAAMRAAIPEFNSVVVRDDGVPQTYPTLPAMTLKNVTVGQFLQFVQAGFPAVQIVRIDGPPGALYSIRIRADDKFLSSLDQGRVHLYRLNEVINGLVAEKARKGKDGKDVDDRDDLIKAATNDVLSLLQAALDQTGEDGPSSLKIHEPTLTLMFKGSRAKQQILEEALATLQPRPLRGVRYSSGSSFDPWSQAQQDSPNVYQLKQLIDQANALSAEGKDLEMKAKSLPPVAPTPPASPKHQKD